MDLIAAARVAQRRQKRTLAEAITGTTVTATSEAPKPMRGGFDGGVRVPLPPPRNPEHDHDQLIVELARVSRTFRASV